MSRAKSFGLIPLACVLVIAGCQVKSDTATSDGGKAPSGETGGVLSALRPKPSIEVPAGSTLPLELQTSLSSARSREGELVVAHLTQDVMSGERVALPKGSELRGRVTAAVPSGRVKGRARLAFAFDTIVIDGREQPIEVSDIDITARSAKGRDAKVIGGSAGAGLIIGALIDGKKGAAIGTAVGAGAGTGVTLATKGYEVELGQGAALRATLEKPVRL